MENSIYSKGYVFPEHIHVYLDKLKSIEQEELSIERISNHLGIQENSVYELLNILSKNGFFIQKKNNKIIFSKIPQRLTFSDEYIKKNNVTLFDVIESTNDYLINGYNNYQEGVVISEYQNKGRGRRDRKFYSTYGSQLLFSLGIYFDSFEDIASLSIVVGIAIAECFTRLGIEHVKLKWPNDIYLCEKKMGGILIETKQVLVDGCLKIWTVVGIGLNIDIIEQDELRKFISQDFISLYSISCNRRYSRDRIFENLLNDIHKYITLTKDDLSKFISKFNNYDIYYGNKVILKNENIRFSGIERGINEKGQLIIETEDRKILNINVGELSLRPC